MPFDPTTLAYAILGGILPALLWLWFWLKEDRKNPEPPRLIFFTFLGGMAAVLLALPLEQYAAGLLTGTTVIAAWSAIEELLKFGFAWMIALRRCATDEPVDPLIYMITAALGFAALENTFFLFGPLMDGNIAQSIVTGNLRFVGATLLHTLSSAAIGGAIGLAFYRHHARKFIYTVAGVILSIVLHALFNSFIIKNNGENVLLVFFFVWTGIIILFLLFERVKRIKKPRYNA